MPIDSPDGSSRSMLPPLSEEVASSTKALAATIMPKGLCVSILSMIIYYRSDLGVLPA
jgi:hypothetical protein